MFRLCFVNNCREHRFRIAKISPTLLYPGEPRLNIKRALMITGRLGKKASPIIACFSRIKLPMPMEKIAGAAVSNDSPFLVNRSTWRIYNIDNGLKHVCCKLEVQPLFKRPGIS